MPKVKLTSIRGAGTLEEKYIWDVDFPDEAAARRFMNVYNPDAIKRAYRNMTERKSGDLFQLLAPLTNQIKAPCVEAYLGTITLEFIPDEQPTNGRGSPKQPVSNGPAEPDKGKPASDSPQPTGAKGGVPSGGTGQGSKEGGAKGPQGGKESKPS